MTVNDNKHYGQRAKRYIPGGAHTYSKGDDQFSSNAPDVITRGEGCYIWDAEDNKFTDFALSLGTVVLGHAYEPVLDSVRAELLKGVNFVRPSVIEGELAELLCDIIPCAEMVKLAKHGSDVTTASIKLARAYTGKERVVRCSADAFNAVHDWFIGSTVVDRGVPKAVKDLTLQFEYNNIDSLKALFSQYPGEIACVIFEPISFIEPKAGFLQAVKDLCEKNNALLIFDEVVSGFRFSLGGGQEYCGVTPHLAAFGKAMANGFSVSALAGRKDIMQLGGIEGEQERVFLLSTTHGGETHSIAAAIKTINTIREHNIIEHIWNIGGLIKAGLTKAAKDAGISDLVNVGGYDCKPAFALVDATGKPCMVTRTLFLQETIKRGILMPYIVPSFAHNAQVIDQSMERITEAFCVIDKARKENNIAGYVEGDIVKPVFRKFN
ncbi:glutamate-1-semialdehyde 2,1-aminomutase [Colwellia sp. 1_MG-2023]|uniref:glutamate-1-semialdehyde 2,1-aminomutase n=1 Tax=Colwellia sp. 1_MG-2023 TaxID=3062649 RepID=UPI0026E42469|nr:glutamate-1-semialdehyde 2,1-aminomutase [Colwellia sp. 1_MG-2023]MDO6444387.1 glutamate-1-semialdehyde 2,1-aminomutase [Colwellia sp. 1_MG-2023]